MDIEKEEKKKLYKALEKKQLCSVMNNTKWRQLKEVVLTTLPFVPPLQIKTVLEDTPNPQDFDNDNNVYGSGDWMDGVPRPLIEWIRVRPMRLESNGLNITPKVIDISNEFLEILHKYKIPYKIDNNTIYIYGYIRDTSSLTL
ncbi:DUF6678 family protein [Gottfriedia luciferensis]|uniref:DUF6678 family protein n=1 Tax=Gottfriedia luciferensis TaxID=178774 RepID=UPI000B449E91|nr:DUF6678 family protein [Gottfriedia luciferensis]